MKFNPKLFIPILISFVNALSFSIIIPVIYTYGKNFGLNNFETSLLLSSFALSQFFATPIIGRLSDYFGRKPLLIFSLLGTCIGNLISFFAGSAAMLFSARILDGITGGNNSVAQAVIADVTEPHERPKAYGMFGAAFGLAFILGPLLSLALQYISISAPFLAASAAALIASLLTWFYLPETLHERSSKLHFKNLGFRALIKAFQRSTLGVTFLLVFLSALAFGSFQYGFQPYVTETFSISTQGISIAIFLFGIASTISQMWIAPKLSYKLGYYRTLFLSLGISIFAVSLLIIPEQFYGFLVISPLYGLCGFMYRPIASSIVSVSSKAEEKGMYLGVMESYYSLATSIGPILAGFASEKALSYPFFLSSLVLFIALSFLLLSQRFIKRVSA